MTTISEGRLAFTFGAGWDAIKFDDTAWHRQAMKGHLCAVDILAHDLVSHWWIEIKDCKTFEQANMPRFSGTDPAEVTDTKAWVKLQGWDAVTKVSRKKIFIVDEVMAKMKETLLSLSIAHRRLNPELSAFFNLVAPPVTLTIVLILTLDIPDYKRLAKLLHQKLTSACSRTASIVLSSMKRRRYPVSIARWRALSDPENRAQATLPGLPIYLSQGVYSDAPALPTMFTIYHLLQRGAPDAAALIDRGVTWTYAQLRTEVTRQATALAAAGVRAGDRVMVVSENCAAQVALIFAIASLRAWIVNVNARLSAGELASIEAHSGARLVIRIDGATVHTGPRNDDCAPEPDLDVAALIYTTGTTGAPKGVLLTHANLLFVAQASSTLREVVATDRAYGVLPISHVYGLTSVLLGTLYAGACLVLEPRFTPNAMLAALPGLTILQGVPAMYARLLDACGGARIATSLRFIYAGGSPLDPDLKARVEQAFGLPLHNGYGLTETAPTVSQTRLDAPRADTSVGMAIPGVDVKLVGEELWVRGPNVMRGYYKGPAAVADDGWFNTGDMARIDPDGAIFITGRTKELIIRAGFNVYPLEVETAINAHPDVALAAVVGRPLPDGDEEVVAYVQARAGCAAPDLKDWLTERLAPYKRPARIVFMDALPAAANGKVLKHRLD